MRSVISCITSRDQHCLRGFLKHQQAFLIPRGNQGMVVVARSAISCISGRDLLLRLPGFWKPGQAFLIS
jgi:hypothetical protein